MIILNEFTKSPEIIFISYEEVIKSPYPFIIKQIQEKYKDYYKDYINFDLIDNLDLDNINRLCVQRQEKNILKYLSKKEFDFITALNDIYKKFDDMFIKSDFLSIGKNIHFLLSQKFTQRIYMYTPIYDKRIHLDIQMNFKDMDKIKYVTGDFFEVVKSLDGITSYILNDIMDVSTLLSTNKISYTNILLANYGYNYTLNENGKLILRLNIDEIMKEKIFKFVTFTPIDFSESHFSALNTPK